MNKNLLEKDLNHILDNTKNLWKELDGKRIFITGGTGFWGLWLLESFVWAIDNLKLKSEMVVLTRDAALFKAKFPHLANHKTITLHSGDVRNFEYPKGTFDFIVHAATDIVKNNNAETTLDTIIRGTDHTLRFATLCEAKKFLLTSSGAVYGKVSPGMKYIPEDYRGDIDLTTPNGVYGFGKRISEEIGYEYAEKYDLEVKIARGFACVGPYMQLNAHFAIGNFILNGLRGEPIAVRGDGTAYRSYLYAADLAIWLWTILFKGKSSYPYNVGSDEKITIENLANIIAVSFTSMPQVVIGEKPTSAKFPEYYVPSVQRIRQELLFYPIMMLDEAIENTKKWYLEKNNGSK